MLVLALIFHRLVIVYKLPVVVVANPNRTVYNCESLAHTIQHGTKLHNNQCQQRPFQPSSSASFLSDQRNPRKVQHQQRYQRLHEKEKQQQHVCSSDTSNTQHQQNERQ